MEKEPTLAKALALTRYFPKIYIFLIICDVSSNGTSDTKNEWMKLKIEDLTVGAKTLVGSIENSALNFEYSSNAYKTPQTSHIFSPLSLFLFETVFVSMKI